MKDLLKGQNPGVLLAVALTCLLMAYAARNNMLGEGHTTTDANFFFFMILAGGIGIYFIIYEGVKELSGFFFRRALKKRGIIPIQKPQLVEEVVSPAPQEANLSSESSNTSSSEVKREDITSTPPSATESMTREDVMCMIETALAKEKKEITDTMDMPLADTDEKGLSIDISKLSKQADEEFEKDRLAMLHESMLYTLEVLGSHMTQDELRILLSRLGKLQKAATSEWTIKEKGETEIKLLRPFYPIDKVSLLHYGWNVGRLFDKAGAQIAFFLKSTFAQHFDKMSLRTISKKLTNEPNKGVIRLEYEFSPNYRERSDTEARMKADAIESPNKINEANLEKIDGQEINETSIASESTADIITQQTSEGETKQPKEEISSVRMKITDVKIESEEITEDEEMPDDDEEGKSYKDPWEDEEDDNFDEEPDEPMNAEEFEAWMIKNSRDAENVLAAEADLEESA